jgi:hypothetical protein
MAFKYRARSTEDVEHRATTGGRDDSGIFKPEFKTYKVKDGANYIRLMPATWDNPRHFGYDVWVHYGIGPGNAQVLCLAKMFKRKCPICEARTRGEGGAEVKGEKHPLAPTRRVAVWMVDMNDTAAGLQLWAMAQTLDQDMVKVTKDPETGSYCFPDHPTEGYNISFEKTGDKRQTKYMGIQLGRRPNSVPQRLLDYVEDHPVPSCIIVPTYEEVQMMYDGGAGPEDDTHQTGATDAEDWGSTPDDGRRPDNNRETGKYARETKPDDGWDNAPLPTSEADYGGAAPAEETAAKPTTSRPKVAPKEDPAPAAKAADAPSTGGKAQSLRERFAQRNKATT